MTLAHASCRTVAMVTDKPTHTSYSAFDLGARTRYRFPLLTRTSVTDIVGRDRVRAVEVTDHATGERSVIECDTVVFTGDWIAENELPRRLGVDMNAATTGPVVDGRFRTSRAGVFAIGNLLHPASTADRCALDGRSAAAAVAAWTSADPVGWPARAVDVIVAGAGRWAVPSTITADGSDAELLLEVVRPVTRPRVVVTQGERQLWSGRIPWALPTRPVPIPGDWRSQVDPDGVAVRISIT
jgi:hypothetical protein